MILRSARSIVGAHVIVVIRAVVFDIGGVLEITPDLGVQRRWEAQLGLPAGQMRERVGDIWASGNIGAITLDDVHRALRDRLGLNDQELTAFMADIWREYLGTAKAELIE
jgi:putative hydrolase of the HAD superfamily